MPNSAIRYTIDAHDDIEAVSASWYRFAMDNQGDALSDANVLGRSLWDFIADAPTRDIYKQMLARVRQGRLTHFTFRCDGPSCRRLLSMTVSPKDLDAIEFETIVLKLEARESVPLLTHDAPRSADLLRLCAWCNLVDVSSGGDEWVEVEVAMERLRLFEREHMAQLSHGICDSCLVKLTETLATPTRTDPVRGA